VILLLPAVQQIISPEIHAVLQPNLSEKQKENLLQQADKCPEWTFVKYTIFFH